ncbi:LysR family transcriptional regulator [Variovorax sp. NFACC27]|uniref:LysR family transcriptional regulator n=1 Tax=unclassified Variovorax TaxID=663243 RepID=UPI0008966134|nr:DNA-binding transcriptional regulator, LysR family [Variovorax sp. NFACC28]SEG36935.1 DNA-binding transcriptional regulator, LysR family [Variovorax sp. NFACC29]SFD92981.1 DNA-binding transcriptional regulator, LysR family [Variovorax sp. NFACC26]SFH04822.1 DNA-binding transcriptional regulator, LysR family [Variovorax sp. NFACC27]
MQVKAKARTATEAGTQSGARNRAVLGQLSDMDLRLLKVFKSVVDCGGMAAAELELNIGTSTVSRHVKDLETRLGLVLCRRGRAGFALTAEGQRVYDETLRLLASVDAFRGSIDDIHNRMGGQLDVALFDKTATNPQARIGEAIARFTEIAPEVRLAVHVGSINAIEQGVLEGNFQIGIIPAHRASKSLVYADLFDETMLLYCGAGHPLFGVSHDRLTWARLREHHFAGLGYHSPNMELSHRAKLSRMATGFDQEAIATLILSGRFLGFLPDHYAQVFEERGLMKAVLPARFNYACRFVSLLRRSPKPSRAVLAFQECLEQAHRK